MARKTTDNDKITNEDQSPKYPEPQILLIDLDFTLGNTLREKGYNVIYGSFDSYGDSTLRMPDVYTESDIVIINLVDDSKNQNSSTYNSSGYYISPEELKSRITNRLNNIVAYKKDFDRIAEYGGIFLVFSNPVIKIDLSDPMIEPVETITNWDFLSELANVSRFISDDSGEKIDILPSAGLLSKILIPYTREDAFFNCTFFFPEDTRWQPLAINKFGQCVSGILTQETGQGKIFLLPNIQNKADFLLEMLQEILPQYAPNLFPYTEQTTWIQSPQYELPEVLEKQLEIKSIEQKTENRIVSISKDIEALRAKNSYLYQLLTETDDVLVQAVKQALEVLGFTDIVDVDATEKHVDTKGRMLEDLRIEDTEPILLVEVKGLLHKPSDQDALEVRNYLLPRAQMLDTLNVKGLSIINYQRRIPPLKREKPFHENVLNNAEDSNIGLLTTWSLFRLVRNFVQNGWSHKQVKQILFESGEIDIIPSHYKYCGVIESYFKDINVIGIQIEQDLVKLGDVISLEFNVDFVEQPIESMEMDNKQVEQAQEGALVGIKITRNLPPEKIVGAKVYLVSNS